jgi:PRTRC genetic system protein E
MFTELMPLLKQRVLVVTISHVENETICVSVTPKKRENAPEEDAALTIPLAFTGRADELDREFPTQLAGFTESVIRTGSNLEELKAQHAAAVKAVDAENRKRLDEKRKTSAKSTSPAEKPATAPGLEFKDGKPLFGSKGSSEPAATASLFDTVEKQESPAPDATSAGA